MLMLPPPPWDLYHPFSFFLLTISLQTFFPFLDSREIEEDLILSKNHEKVPEALLTYWLNLPLLTIIDSSWKDWLVSLELGIIPTSQGNGLNPPPSGNPFTYSYGFHKECFWNKKWSNILAMWVSFILLILQVGDNFVGSISSIPTSSNLLIKYLNKKSTWVASPHTSN